MSSSTLIPFQFENTKDSEGVWLSDKFQATSKVGQVRLSNIHFLVGLSMYDGNQAKLNARPDFLTMNRVTEDPSFGFDVVNHKSLQPKGTLWTDTEIWNVAVNYGYKVGWFLERLNTNYGVEKIYESEWSVFKICHYKRSGTIWKREEHGLLIPLRYEIFLDYLNRLI